MAWVKSHSHDSVSAALIQLDLIINNGYTATTDWAPVTRCISWQVRIVNGIINEWSKYSQELATTSATKLWAWFPIHRSWVISLFERPALIAHTNEILDTRHSGTNNLEHVYTAVIANDSYLLHERTLYICVVWRFQVNYFQKPCGHSSSRCIGAYLRTMDNTEPFVL